MDLCVYFGSEEMGWIRYAFFHHKYKTKQENKHTKKKRERRNGKIEEKEGKRKGKKEMHNRDNSVQ